MLDETKPKNNLTYVIILVLSVLLNLFGGTGVVPPIVRLFDSPPVWDCSQASGHDAGVE